MTKKHKKYLYEHMVTHVNHEKKTAVAYIEHCKESYMDFVIESLAHYPCIDCIGKENPGLFNTLYLPKKFVVVVKCPDDEKFNDEKYLNLAINRLCDKYETACNNVMAKYLNRIKNHIKL